MSYGTDASGYHQVRLPFDPNRAKVWSVLCHYLQRWVDENGTVLDLGAGYGDFLRFIRAGQKWALEMNPDLTVHWSPEVRPIIQSALERFPIADGSLSTVFASNFFEHFTTEHSSEILGEIRRVLKPGGTLIVVQPNFRLQPKRYFDDYTHKTPYTDTGFRGFLAASQFSVIHTEPRFTPLTLQSRWPKARWMVKLYLDSPFRPMAGQFLAVAER